MTETLRDRFEDSPLLGTVALFALSGILGYTGVLLNEAEVKALSPVVAALWIASASAFLYPIVGQGRRK